MKTIGILGGMSWTSTAEYYKQINQGVQKKLGGVHSAKIVLHSVDFEEIKETQAAGRWAEAAAILGAAGKGLKNAGADFLVLATNTMHKVADEIEAASGLPLLHLADASGEAIRSQGWRTVGLLGTRFTMSEDFYRGRLLQKFGIKVVVPEKDEQQVVNSIIYDELCRDCFQDASAWACQLIIEKLIAQGAEAVLLACTELPLLIKQSEIKVPLLDTVKLHAEEAVRRALQE
ncbi:aspartate/glutamate racemase family protein [Dehalogenimonas sp. 4OHTPN]|uniref:Aspartate/glutamate racemase family protein n=1 Tax=Dehalogenimonas sp. 4OHTPN TaxID=3166643 RepID=A0AAU8GAI7_9CHLR